MRSISLLGRGNYFMRGQGFHKLGALLVATAMTVACARQPNATAVADTATTPAADSDQKLPFDRPAEKNGIAPSESLVPTPAAWAWSAWCSCRPARHCPTLPRRRKSCPLRAQTTRIDDLFCGESAARSAAHSAHCAPSCRGPTPTRIEDWRTTIPFRPSSSTQM